MTRVGAPKGPPLLSSEPGEPDNSPVYQTDDGDPEVFLTAPDYTTDPKNRVDNPDDVRWKKPGVPSQKNGKEAASKRTVPDQAELVRSSQRIQKRQTSTRESVNDMMNYMALLAEVKQAASLLDPDRVQDMAVLFIKQVDTMTTAERIANMVYFGWFRKPESVIWKWGTETWDSVTESHRVTLDQFVRDYAVDMYKHVAMHIAGGETKDGHEAEQMYLGHVPSIGQQYKRRREERKEAS